MRSQQSEKHLLPSLMRWKNGTTPLPDSSLVTGLVSCRHHQEGEDCTTSKTSSSSSSPSPSRSSEHLYVDCEWNCGYPTSAPQDGLPPRRRFVLRGPSGGSSGLGSGAASASSSSSGVVASSTILMSSSLASLSFPRVGGLLGLCKNVMQMVVLFAGVADAYNLFLTCKAMTLWTDPHESLILPELLMGLQRLHLFHSSMQHVRRRSSSSSSSSDFDFPAGHRQLVGDLAARFLAMDPYFKPEQVLHFVFLPLMTMGPYGSIGGCINWTRYHLWLPLLQWFQTYLTLDDASSSSSSSRVFICNLGVFPLAFPIANEWSVPLPWELRNHTTRVPTIRTLTDVPSSTLLVSMWIQLVHSGLIFGKIEFTGQSSRTIDYVDRMVGVLVRSPDWYNHLSRFLEGTKDHLTRCCSAPTMVELWRRVKFSLLMGIGTRLLNMDKAIAFIGRFQPHLLFTWTDISNFQALSKLETWSPVFRMLEDPRFFTYKDASIDHQYGPFSLSLLDL